MELHDGYICIRRASILIPIQRVAPADVYAALRRSGVGESQAVAVASGLITLKVEAK